ALPPPRTPDRPPPPLRLPRRPAVGPLPLGPPLPATFPRRRSPHAQVTHLGVARHVQHVAFLVQPQLGAELGGPAELVIAGHPPVGQPAAAAAEQVQAD